MKKMIVLTVIVLMGAVIFVLPCLAEEMIYGCYQKNNGQLRIVKGADECRPSEVFIKWNEVGAQGPQGVQGPAGPQGERGPAGTADPVVLDLICKLAMDASILPCPTICDCNKKVFVSSQAYTGNLGGLEGADAKCQVLADAAGLKGTFKAWLSAGETCPNTQFTHGLYPYFRVDGALVAGNYADLIDGLLANPINLDEYGNLKNTYVWTFTRYNGDSFGSYYNYHCYFWEMDYARRGWVGISEAIDYTWTDANTVLGCEQELSIYCFQQ